MTMKTEWRSVSAELRVAGTDDAPKIEGYAAVFDSLSVTMEGYRERIRPGAFTKVLNDDVRALFNHDPNYVLGRNRAKTLELIQDDRGLRYSIMPPNTEMARHIVESVRRGDVSGSSFSFRVVRAGIVMRKEEGETIRELVEINSLFDVGPVTNPAYTDSSSEVRSLLSDGGIDADCLNAILIREERGLGVEPDDVATLRSAIARLERAIPGTPMLDAINARLARLSAA